MSDNDNYRETSALKSVQAAHVEASAEANTEGVAPDQPKSAHERASSVAVTQAANQGVAELVARNEAYIQNELAAVKKRMAMAAQPEEDVSAVKAIKRMRAKLTAERKAPSDTKFGIGILCLVILVALVAGGIWYFSAQNAGNSVAATGVTPGAIAVASNISASYVSAPDMTPSAVDNAPVSERAAPPSANEITSTGTDSFPVSGGSNDIGGSEPTVDAGNIAAGALGSDGDGSTAPGATTVSIPGAEAVDAGPGVGSAKSSGL